MQERSKATSFWNKDDLADKQIQGDSEYKQQASFSQVVSLAKNAMGKDESGYRSEFVRLVESTTSFVKK